MIRESSAGESLDRPKVGSPTQRRGILDGGAGMGDAGDDCFSNMGSGSPRVFSADSEVARSMAQFRSGPNPGLPRPSAPSSQAPGVLLWLPGRSGLREELSVLERELIDP